LDRKLNIIDGYVVSDYDEYVRLDKIGVLSIVNSKIYADVGGRQIILTHAMSTVDLASTIQSILAAQSASP
jgi:hypothetical protein